MEFSFNFTLQDGAGLVVDVECTPDDTIIRGVSRPDGALSEARLMDAYLSFTEIEERAREEYRERLERAAAERKDAGIAGERSA